MSYDSLYRPLSFVNSAEQVVKDSERRAYLHTGLGQVDLHGDLLSCVYVWVMSLCKRPLQLLCMYEVNVDNTSKLTSEVDLFEGVSVCMKDSKQRVFIGSILTKDNISTYIRPVPRVLKRVRAHTISPELWGVF